MTGRERILRILNRQDVDRSAFWMGSPTLDAQDLYEEYFGCDSIDELSRLMRDDLVWIQPEFYAAPGFPPMWDTMAGKERVSLGQAGVFAETETVDEIEAFSRWPNPDYVHFMPFEIRYDEAKDRDCAVFSGTWAPIWHVLMDFFGMENCFVKMYTHPEVVLAVMRKMTEFYLTINRRFFEKYGELVDIFFFGNDMGSQLDCMISPEMFRQYIFPFYQQLIDLAKSYGKKVALHSCGAVDRIIPDLIAMGVDILHPIQAKAKNMSAEHLQAAYGGQIMFLGGVDTQELLPFGTEQAVEDEVLRLRRIFGPHYICSPSHEALLPNVSPQKLKIMSETARRIL